MFSRVVHKTKHRCVFCFFFVLLCFSDPSVRHVEFWDTEQAVMQGLLLSNRRNKIMLKEDMFCLKMSPCILALEANSRLGHIFFPVQTSILARANLEFSCCRITLSSVQVFLNIQANPGNQKYVTFKAISCWWHFSFQLFFNRLETTTSPGQIRLSAL